MRVGASRRHGTVGCMATAMQGGALAGGRCRIGRVYRMSSCMRVTISVILGFYRVGVAVTVTITVKANIGRGYEDV